MSLIAAVVLVAVSPGGLRGLRGILALLVLSVVLLVARSWRRRG